MTGIEQNILHLELDEMVDAASTPETRLRVFTNKSGDWLWKVPDGTELAMALIVEQPGKDPLVVPIQCVDDLGEMKHMVSVVIASAKANEIQVVDRRN